MTWVLLRCLARESRHWGDFTQLLTSTTGQAVLTLDLPSNGSLCADASPASVNGLLHAVRLQINDRGTELPVNVLAMSLGGMVATHWAQHYPHEVARRVLINTSMRPFSGLAERLPPGSCIPLAKLALHWGRTSHVEEIKSAIHRLTCKQTAYRASDLAQWSHIRRSAPVSAANVLRQLWAAA